EAHRQGSGRARQPAGAGLDRGARRAADRPSGPGLSHEGHPGQLVPVLVGTLPAAVAADVPTTLRRTPLHDRHVEAGARLVPFAGWDMPVQYEGVRAEHIAVR